LVDIWAEVLNIEKKVIGIHANFFEIGGHSLNATNLITRIHKELYVKVPIAEIFNHPTVEELSGYIAGAKKVKFSSIKPVEKKDYYSLSPAQKRLYIQQQMDFDSIAYNISQTLYLESDTNNEQLERAFIKLIRRHESLRTSFEPANDEPVQRLQDEAEFKIEYHKVEVKAEEGGLAPLSKEPAAALISSFIRPFDLSKPPLLRVGLIITGNNQNILLIDMHHIISDAISHQILAQDFMALYEGKELPALKLRYKDYAEWKNTDEQQKLIKQHEEYWLNEFSTDMPGLDLPADFPRPSFQSFEGSSVDFVLNKTETGAIRNIIKDTDSTLYMVFFSIFDIFLARLGGVEDIVVGIPTAGRNHADLEHIVGMFVNTLALRNYPTGDKTFKEFLTQVKERSLEAFENQDYPFENLVEKISPKRDAGRPPVFNVMFNLLTRTEQEKYSIDTVNELRRDSYIHRKGTAKFDINLKCVELENQMHLTLSYSTRLFTPETIDKFIGYFKEIIAIIIRDNNIKLKDINISQPLLSPEKIPIRDEFVFA